MRYLLFILTVCACLHVQAQLNGTYYISDVGGGDYLSISAAVNDLNTLGISGPVTFQVASNSGPYTDQILITQGGTAAWPIVFEGNNSTIEFSPSVYQDYHIVRVENANYITFRQLDLKAPSGTSAAWAYHIFGNSSNITIEDCKINIPGNQTNSNLTGVVANGTKNTTHDWPGTIGPNYITIKDCIFFGGHTAITINSLSTNASIGHIIADNIISNTRVRGITMSAVKDVEIHNNRIALSVIELSLFSDNGTAIQIGFPRGNIDVTRNRINSFADKGLHLYASDGTADILIANNFIGGDNIGYGAVGFEIGNGAAFGNIKIWHNTIIMDGVGSGICMRIYSPAPADVRNNSFINHLSGGYCLDIEHPFILMTLDYNNYWSDAGYYATDWDGQYLTSYADFLAAVGPAGGHDLNSLNFNPPHLSNSNPHLSGFLLESKGAPGLVAFDIDGDTRNTIPDIGADEFTNPDEDASPIELVSPVNGVAGVYPVQVNVLNLGTLDLSSVQVFVEINDGTSSTIIGPATYSGTPVPYNANALVDLGTYNFTERDYTITLTTSLPNGVIDTVTYNNELEVYRGFCSALSGVYTINQDAPATNTNFTTVQKAFDEVAFCGIAGPVRFKITRGTGPYTEQFVINDVLGTSSVNTITLDGQGETIQYTITESGFQYVGKLDGASYVNIERCVFRDIESPLESWLLMISNGANNIRIENNRFYQIDTFETFPDYTANDYSAIGIGNSVHTTPTTSANNIHIENNEIHDGHVGIFSYGIDANYNRGGLTNVTVLNNIIENFKDHGIEIWSAINVNITGNKVFGDRTTGSFTHGIRVRAAADIEIVANDIDTRAYKGIELVSNNYDTNTITLVKNNFIIVRDGYDECIEIRDTRNTKIYNNSLLGLGIRTDGMSLETDPSAGIDIQNNSIVSMASIEAYGIDWETSFDATVNFQNNNIYSSTGALIYDYPSAVANNLTELIAATGDVNALALDPLYTSIADLHLQAGSALIDAGGSIVANYDFDGGLRTGIPDIGADEFGAACEIPANPYTDNITASMASMHWDPSASASGYILLGGKVPGGLKTIQTGLTDLTFSIFQPSTNYRWKVQAVCPYRNSEFSAFEFFTTPAFKLSAASDEIQVFPNPATDLTNVVFSSNIDEEILFELYSSNGKLVYVSSGFYSTGSHSKSIDVNSLPSGMYQLKITQNENVELIQLAIQ